MGGQVEIWFAFLIKNRSDAFGSKAESLERKINSLTKSTRLEMHVSISTIAVTPCSILKITDHGKCQASVTRQVLSQTESCRYQTLVSLLDYFHLSVLGPVAVNTPRQACTAVNVKK